MTVPRLGLHLTDRCQLDCQHCLRDPSRAAKDLDVELIGRIVAEGRTRYGIAQVSLTGGEPTLHPRFYEIVDIIVDHGMQWDMVSNGRTLPTVLSRLEPRPSRLAHFRMVSLSLDGAEEATHDSIREHGSFREVMTAAALCSAKQLPFGIQMAVNARNAHELESVGLLAAKLGARHVSYAMTQPTGTLHDQALFLPASDWRRLKARLEALSTILRIPVVLPEGHYEEALFSSCGPFRGETLHVNVEGRLSMCCLHSQVPGAEPGNDVAANLAETSLVEGHRRLLELVRRAQDGALAALSVTDAGDEWAHFGCNRCLARFGRPSWSAAGAVGPTANRERWHGVWAPGTDRHAAPSHDVHRLRIVR